MTESTECPTDICDTVPVGGGWYESEGDILTEDEAFDETHGE